MSIGDYRSQRLFFSEHDIIIQSPLMQNIIKLMKTKFVYQNKFETLEELQLELAEYVYWYNNLRIHGSLGYLTPMEYRELSTLKLTG